MYELGFARLDQHLSVLVGLVSLMMHVSTRVAYTSVCVGFNYFYFYFKFKIVRLFLVRLFLLIIHKEDIFRCIFISSVHHDGGI